MIYQKLMVRVIEAQKKNDERSINKTTWTMCINIADTKKVYITEKI